jgi:hypothetical protein
MKHPKPDLEPVPTALRAAITRDLEPVTALVSPWRRALAVTLPALAVLAPLMILIVRPADSPSLRSFSGGGISIIEWVVGVLLLWLALREAVPGLGAGAVRSLLAIVTGVAVQLGLGLYSWYESGSPLGGPDGVRIGARCTTIVGVLGLPHVAVATWLAFRALPIRPRWSGALAGAAAGLVADAVWHLACARNDLEHLLLWHITATVAMTLVGAFTGSWWSTRRGGGRR